MDSMFAEIVKPSYTDKVKYYQEVCCNIQRNQCPVFDLHLNESTNTWEVCNEVLN